MYFGKYYESNLRDLKKKIIIYMILDIYENFQPQNCCGNSVYGRTLLALSCLLNNFGALYLTEFLTDFGQILNSNSYDQAQQTL